MSYVFSMHVPGVVTYTRVQKYDVHVPIAKVIAAHTWSPTTELHQQNLENLKKKVDYLAETDWKYAPAQKLIGLEWLSLEATTGGGVPNTDGD